MWRAIKKTKVPKASMYISIGLSSNKNSLYCGKLVWFIISLTIVMFFKLVFHFPTIYVSLTVLFVKVVGSTIKGGFIMVWPALSTMKSVYYVKWVAEHKTSPVWLLIEFRVILVPDQVSANLSLLSHLNWALPFKNFSLYSSLSLNVIRTGVVKLAIDK